MNEPSTTNYFFKPRPPIPIPSSNNITATESPFSPAVTQDHQSSIGDTRIIGNEPFLCTSMLQKSREQEMCIMAALQSLNVAKLGDLQRSINVAAKLHMVLEQCRSHQKQLIDLISSNPGMICS